MHRIKNLALILLIILASNLNPVAAATSVQITLKGIKGELLENVRALLSLEQQKTLTNLSENRIKQLHQQAPTEIQQALQPFGYYRVQVTTSQLEPPVSGKKTWHAKYVIDLGPPLKLKAVTLHLNGEGKEDEALQKLLTKFPLKKGDVLNHATYETGKKQLSSLALERGYFDAQFTRHEIRIDERAYDAQITLHFETGERYRFGEVTFNQDIFIPSVLERYFTFHPGEFYLNTKLLAFQNALNDSDYFSDVRVETHPSAPDKIVPIEVTLEPRKAKRFSVAPGYGTDTGVRGSIEWERRYLNRWGHRFKTVIQLSEVRNALTARYFIPSGKTKDDYWTAAAIYKDEAVDTSDSELLSVGFNKNQLRPFLGRDTQQTLGLDYRDEIYHVGSDSGHSRLLMPSLSLSYTKADDRIYTTHGQKIQLTARGAQSGLGSNTSFLQGQLSGIFVRKFLERGRVIVRGEVGHTLTPAFLGGEFSQLPPSIRFFAGGDRSVRGYDYKALGPKNAEGEVIGGENLLVGSAEYEYRIWDKWGIAAFYDIGNAFNGLSVPLKQGVGVGVHWLSPIGAIRLDVAVALSEEDDYPLRVHIMVGPDF